MNTKLTLRLDKALIQDAKVYAKKEGKSISQIVSEYFNAISKRNSDKKEIKLKPIVSKLYGSLKGSSISKKDYKKHIKNKYL